MREALKSEKNQFVKILRWVLHQINHKKQHLYRLNTELMICFLHFFPFKVKSDQLSHKYLKYKYFFLSHANIVIPFNLMRILKVKREIFYNTNGVII